MLWFLELIALVACAAVGTLAGLIASWLAGRSWAAVLAASWVVLAIEAAGIIPCVGWAYRRFDVSLDTPP